MSLDLPESLIRLINDKRSELDRTRIKELEERNKKLQNVVDRYFVLCSMCKNYIHKTKSIQITSLTRSSLTRSCLHLPSEVCKTCKKQGLIKICGCGKACCPECIVDKKCETCSQYRCFQCKNENLCRPCKSLIQGVDYECNTCKRIFYTESLYNRHVFRGPCLPDYN